MKRKLVWGALALFLIWSGYVGLVYARMNAAPADFNQFMSGVPMPAMMVVPFETLWNRARGGALREGDPAPDFELRFYNGTGSVRLSEARGVRPVLLIFGSYT